VVQSSETEERCMNGERKRKNWRKQTTECQHVCLAAKWLELEEEINNWVMVTINGISI
jgi:hypothetical protein